MKTEHKKQITSEIESYLSRHKITAQALSTKSGVNASVISAIRAGKNSIPAGAGKEVEIADKYYEILADTMGLKFEKTYWETRPTAQLGRILATLQDAKEFGYTNVIIGTTGCGKTFSVDVFAKKHPQDVFKITVGASDTINDLIDKIVDEVKPSCATKSKSKKIKEVCSKLRVMKFSGLKPTIIFDESEYMRLNALCAMKELYDALNGVCGIILIGTPQLIENIEKLKRKNKEGIPQLYRRIKFGIRMLPEIDRTFVDFITEEDAHLTKFLRANCDNYGELHDLLVPARRESERTGEALTEQFIRTIFNLNTL